MPTGAEIVAKARSYAGQHEVPMGSNTGPFVQVCQADTFLGGTGWPWCAAFVCRVAKECGVPLDPNDSAGAHDLANRHKANWKPLTWVRPGMVVDYNIGSGHTGIVTGIDEKDGAVISIDGNWSDSVVEHRMPLSEVRAFWAIPGVQYEPAPKPPAPKPPTPAKPKVAPAFFVTTSASGHRKLVFRTPTGEAGKRSLIRFLVRHTITKLAPNGITITRGKAK